MVLIADAIEGECHVRARAEHVCAEREITKQLAIRLYAGPRHHQLREREYPVAAWGYESVGAGWLEQYAPSIGRLQATFGTMLLLRIAEGAYADCIRRCGAGSTRQGTPLADARL